MTTPEGASLVMPSSDTLHHCIRLTHIALSDSVLNASGSLCHIKIINECLVQVCANLSNYRLSIRTSWLCLDHKKNNSLERFEVDRIYLLVIVELLAYLVPEVMHYVIGQSDLSRGVCCDDTSISAQLNVIL